MDSPLPARRRRLVQRIRDLLAIVFTKLREWQGLRRGPFAYLRYLPGPRSGRARTSVDMALLVLVVEVAAQGAGTGSN